MKKEYDFEIEKRNVQVAGSGLIPNLKAIVRKDNNNILATVSDRYQIVTHSQVVDQFEVALNSLGGSFKNRNIVTTLPYNGAKMLRKYTFPDIRINIGKDKITGKDDEFDLTLELRNSYDGSMRVGYSFGAYRLLCLNGMFIGSKFVEMMSKHFSSIDVDNMTQNLKNCPEILEMQLDKWEQWKSTSMTEEEVENDLSKINIPKKYIRMMIERFKKEESTKYGFYNATTNIITHSIKARKDEANTRWNQLNFENEISKLFY